jgi:ABC-2 type transport system ATP-binding protein
MSRTAASTPAILVEGVSKRFGRVLALDDVSLSVPQGETFALLGPNGAGKSSLIDILCTISQPDGGRAQIAGVDVVKQPLCARKQLGVVFQEATLDTRLSVFENLDFHGMVYQMSRADRRRRIDEMLALVELSDWRDAVVRTLSSGMRRRLEIARGLMHEPKILFLDEPTIGLDTQSRAKIWSYLEQLRASQNLTIIVTTHYIEEVDTCDTICIIDHGKILASGTPESLKAAHGTSLFRVTPRAAITEALIASTTFSDTDLDITVLGAPLERIPLGIGFWKGDLTLKRAVQSTIANIRADGTLIRLAERYDLDVEALCPSETGAC